MRASLIAQVLAGVTFFLILTGPAGAEKNRYGVAVIIGNRNYQNRVPSVDFAHRDAAAFKRFVIDVLGYRQGNIIYLLDASQGQMTGVFGSKTNYQGKLYQYIRSNKSDVVIYYSGHGVPGLKDRQGYLLPTDANPDMVELNGYPLQQLYNNLGKLQAKSIVVYLDACFSGDSQKGMLIQSASGIMVVPKETINTDHLTIITAASGTQLASWDTKSSHGLFTETLLQGLYGKADEKEFGGNGDNTVTLLEMKQWLDDEMTYSARRYYNRKQVATIKGNKHFALVKHTGRSIVRPEIPLNLEPPNEILDKSREENAPVERKDRMVFRINTVKFQGNEIPELARIVSMVMGNLPDAIVQTGPPEKGDITVTALIVKNTMEREDNPDFLGGQLATAFFGKSIGTFTKNIPKYIYHYEVDVVVTAKNTRTREVKTANGSVYLRSHKGDASSQVLTEALTEGARNLSILLIGGVLQPHVSAGTKRHQVLMALKKNEASNNTNPHSDY